jgi:uncharacterized protein YprB with RNaseH-like and TPR domain
MDRQAIIRFLAEMYDTQDSQPAPIEALLEGEVRASPAGVHFVAQRLSSPDDWHGCLPLSWLLQHQDYSRRLLSQWVGADTAPDWSQALFLDTETTGLRPGEGTTVFLVGLGWFEGGFQIEQILMRSPEEEPSLLHEVSERIAAAALLVTFNGRGFDLPVLAARYQRAGLPAPPVPPHLDLLAVARRRWRRVLSSCSLASLEFHRLAVEREYDVPGSQVPGLYRAYLETGDGRLLAPILEHNAIDILSMVTLAAVLCRDNED